MNRNSIAFILLTIVIASCGDNGESTLFKIRTGPELGIDFKNTIVTNDTFNAVTYEYIYNGSGVGVGDFNNDGLQDLFFGGNQVPSQLYINKGKLHFTNGTEKSKIATHSWVTGVSLVDINRDGLLDIYLCVAGKVPAEQRRNLLFINQGINDGIPSFIESSKSYGLDDDRYATMS
ncbi:MAG TPA: VCBS repeat-containing protein, partial [Chryseolinea sp.]|nr:VCBS repeat-containing protein [Chryseolinea sp.]